MPLRTRAAVLNYGFSSLEQAVDDAMSRAELPDLHVRDCLFVHGTDVREIREFFQSPARRPVQSVDPRHLAAFEQHYRGLARRYKWIRATGWSEEIVLSTFLRVSKLGDNLYIECAEHVLGPVAEHFRAIDRVPRPDLWSQLAVAARGALTAPFVAVLSPFLLIERLSEVFRRALGRDDPATARALRQIEQGLGHDYGAEPGLRAELDAHYYRHHYQSQDADMIKKIIDKRITTALLDVLDRHGVDTSDIKEQTNAILNQGIIVQGGNVEAKNLAVGAGARVSGVFSRVTGRAAPAKEAGAA